MRVIVCISSGVLLYLLGLIYADPAYANPVVAWGFMSGTEDMYFGSTWGRIITLGAFIVIETIVLIFITRLGFWKSLLASLLMNIISAASGLALHYPVDYVIWAWWIVPIVLACAIPFLYKAIPWHYSIVGIISILGGSLALLWNTETVLPAKPALFIVQMILPLFLPFGLSLMIEPIPGRFFISRKELWKSILLINLISYIIFAILVPFTAPGMSSYRSAYKVNYLRSLGTTQLSYQQLSDLTHNNLQRKIKWLGEAVQRSTSVLDEINPATEEYKETEWLLRHNDFYYRMLNAISDEDQEYLNETYMLWTSWYEATSEIPLASGIDTPEQFTESALADFESDLEMPTE